MFEKITSAVKGVLQKMGLIKSIQSVSEIKSIPIDDKFYQTIDMWKALYQGYFSDWHDVHYQTINGRKKRRMSTLMMPKMLSQEMATLIFNERCEINISDQGLYEKIKSIFDDNKFTKRFQDYLEFQFALGGMVIKPYVTDGKIKLSYVTADCFIPISWDNQGIHEAVFPHEIRKGDKKYTHLEWHLWEGKEYVIKNELYVADKNSGDIGRKVPLSTLFPDLEEEVRIKDFKRSGFVYFRPNLANHIDMSSPLGIPIFAAALDEIKTLDIAFDSYQREFRLGKRRILVPASALKPVINKTTGNLERYFDADDEVYEGFNTGDEDGKIQDNSVSLRVEEHIAGINSLLDLISMKTGFSSGSFSFDGRSVKTATEVVSENSKTFRTKQSHENIIESALTELVEVIVQLAELYGIFTRPADGWEVTVAFDDSIAEDQTSEIGKQVQMLSNKVTTRKKAIMKLHGLSEKEAEQLLKEINAETATATAEAIDFFGMNKKTKTSGE